VQCRIEQRTSYRAYKKVLPIEILLILVAVLLAYANGANDNFKGVATLYGSGVLRYRTANWLSTAATLVGAVAAALLAEQLAKAFSGRGLVPEAVAAQPIFAIAVALAAGMTVLIATRIGMPISTTHALVGGLVGAGLAAAASGLNAHALGQQFIAPLLLGPVVALVACAVLNGITRRIIPPQAQDAVCACVTPMHASLATYGNASHAVPSMSSAGVTVGTLTDPACARAAESTAGAVLTASSVMNAAHIMSGVLVCIARGLNDAPKIAGLLLVAKAANVSLSTAAIAIAMALGGFLHSRRIAETMGNKITTLEPRSAFIANVCTATLVIAASKFGLPLSTTHVSVGSISGLAFSGDQNAALSRSTMKHILLTWIFTLPVAALLASLAYVTLAQRSP
jgi:inorganic phosphate transporter, PiT family